MHGGAGGNVFERQRIAHQDVRFRTRGDGLANLQAYRLKNVALLAVRIVHQRDAGRTVGVVLDRRHLARDAVLVALEVDQAQFLLMPAAVVANREVARVAASARPLAHREQRLVRRIRRQVVVHQRGLEAQRRRYRSVCLDRHRLCPEEPALKNLSRRSPRFSGTPYSSSSPDNPSWSSPTDHCSLTTVYCLTDCSHTPAASRRP